jgi:hypothetical protein
MAKEKVKTEVHITPGKIMTAVEGLADSSFPKTSPFFKMYGIGKDPGDQAPDCHRPDGSGEAQIVGKFKRGKGS